MTDTDRHPLDAELAQLREALRAAPVPPPDEAALRAAFRAARQRIDTARAAPRRGGSWRLQAAAAAVVVLGLAAVLGTVLRSDERSIAAPAPAAAPPAVQTVAAFQPLLNSPGFAPSAAYSVVRVRIPLASLALVPGTERGGTIEADLLVGEDGLARGIRFNPADAMLVSTPSR